MTFVNAPSTFLGRAPQASINKCQLRHPVNFRQSRVRMSFSSIDTPENAVTASDSSFDDKELVIHAAYIQVFGNAYLMESERAGLAVIESDFKNGDIEVRDMIRAMAKSEAYRKRFFARSGPYRFVELNCKHFLGRGPNSQQEVSFHVQKLMTEGYDAEIDSYFDSGEYEEMFGHEGVPRFVFRGTYERLDNFSRMTILRKHWDGCSTSTVSGSTAPGGPIPAQLTMGHGGYINGFVGIMKGLPAGFRPAPSTAEKPPPIPANSRAPLRVRIKVAENCYQVYEVPSLPGVDPEPAWQKELSGKKTWNGVWF